jgi:ribonuclease P/MRP protein subunit RPP1
MTDSGPGPYVAATPTPTGESSVARLAATAARSGFEGLVVRAPPGGPETPPDTDESEYLRAVAEEHDIDVVDGVEVNPEDPAEARGHVGNLREESTVLVVRGGTPELNRFAAESPKVDILAAPMAGEGDVNHVVVRAAVENEVHIEFDLDRVLRASGGGRVQALRGLRKLRELVGHFDAPHVLSSAPRSHLELRAPRELIAVGEAVGFDAGTVEDGLAAWGRLAARNRERRSESFVAPGVYRGLGGDEE